MGGYQANAIPKGLGKMLSNQTIRTYTDMTGTTDVVAHVLGHDWAHVATIPVLRSRGARRAGAYIYRRNMVTGERFDERMELHRNLRPDDLRATLLHELAHIAQTYTTGFSNHGAQWRCFALALGCDDRACTTSLKGSAYLNADARYQYRCADCGAVVRKVRRPTWDVPVGMRANRVHIECHRAHRENRGQLIRMSIEEIEIQRTKE
jgi:predicted SprT family Zn-dependent metalloprotease